LSSSLGWAAFLVTSKVSIFNIVISYLLNVIRYRLYVICCLVMVAVATCNIQHFNI
jgi:hypothetical protein